MSAVAAEEKCSLRDMELKLFLAPFDQVHDDAYDDQMLMWVCVERWDWFPGPGPGPGVIHRPVAVSSTLHRSWLDVS